jgi:hypothetical protein
MPTEPTYPGVYVEEIGFRATIRRLGTAQALFLGTFPDGPFDQPRHVASLQQLSEIFGRDAGATICGRSLELFTRNGGTNPIVVRIRQDEVASGLRSVAEPCELLCIPETAAMAPHGAPAAINTARDWAVRNRVFYLVDLPHHPSAAAVSHWLAANPAIRSTNIATYWPQVMTPSGNRVPPGGIVAGVIARNDSDRGVWKAPAGTEADLRGITGLSRTVTDSDLEVLAAAGVNPLRHLARGPVVWGARTMSSDPEWQYIPVRRLALLIEKSVAQGTRWAVFEPNTAALWQEVRQAVEGFLHDLWRHGALQGASPDDAYFVWCGRDTMTQDDIDSGRLIIHIGFAPLKPAEFVILRIDQKTAQSVGISPANLGRLLQTAAQLGRAEPYHLLFAGPSGAGKKMLARALAARLERPLVRIDLAAAMSKYIGETEKNLAALFEQAVSSHAILFFDEADALLGERATTKSGPDRHANLEAGHLLRRIEQHPGIVIMAAERIGKLDRRFSVVEVAPEAQ